MIASIEFAIVGYSRRSFDLLIGIVEDCDKGILLDLIDFTRLD